MKKQFNLEYYKKHPGVKIVTRNGLPVRILCTDRKDIIYPIVALLDDNGSEDYVSYTIDGYMYTGTAHKEHWGDLVFDLPDPEKKRVPLTYEDLMKRVKSGKTLFVIDTTDEVIAQIVTFSEDKTTVVIKGKIYELNYRWMLTYYFANGDRCWKEVEE